MANYVLTPENTEIKISYRGLIPLIIIKSSLFDNKELSQYDIFDSSSLHIDQYKILAPVLGYGWQRKYRNVILNQIYYNMMLKSGGDPIGETNKEVSLIVSPEVNISKSQTREFEGYQYAVLVKYIIQAGGLSRTSTKFYINVPDSNVGNLENGLETLIYYPPLTWAFIDSNGTYKGGKLQDTGEESVDKSGAKDPKFTSTYEINLESSLIFFVKDDDYQIVKNIYDAEATDPNNPYSGGGTSGPGGGGGTFSGDNDPIDIPDLPSISAVDAGFITIYKPSLDELRNLSKYMWSDLFSLDSFKKIFADPIDCILGLNIMPFGIASAGKANVYVGNMDTGISMTLAQQQYVAVDCGSVKAAEYSGSFFDYSPHTKYNIYLPYIGIEPLDPDEITGKDIRVVYHIDILTGSLICFVKIGNAVMYEYQGSCGQTIPINGSDFTSVFMGAVQIAGNVAGMVSTGGASAGAIAGGLLSSTSTAAGMKPNIEKSGSLSGAGGFLGNQKPFIIKETPRQCMPLSQQKYTGFPSYQTQKLGSVSGYTEIESVNLSGIPANDSELSEIESLLKGGVYL